jgi:4'-phosphopantetheinyl transferase
MTAKVYLSKNNSLWDEAKLNESLVKLPTSLREKIVTYKNPTDRQSRITGKLMLMKLIEDLDLKLTLDDLLYTTYHKPYFEPPTPLKGALTANRFSFDFSIAHSGDVVLCAGTTEGKIGIDVEQIREISITDYRDQLTGNEWQSIQESEDRLQEFYTIWTKKEALLKATGRGVDMDMSAIDVCADEISLNGVTYYLSPIQIHDGYVAHMACTIQTDISLRVFEFI